MGYLKKLPAAILQLILEVTNCCFCSEHKTTNSWPLRHSLENVIRKMPDKPFVVVVVVFVLWFKVVEIFSWEHVSVFCCETACSSPFPPLLFFNCCFEIKPFGVRFSEENLSSDIFLHLMKNVKTYCYSALIRDWNNLGISHTPRDTQTTQTAMTKWKLSCFNNTVVLLLA